VALHRISCPECKTGLKSASGFTPGKTVLCPKCESYFVVEEPEGPTESEEPKRTARPTGGKDKTAPVKKTVKAAVVTDDEEDDDRPKKKKKKKDDDEPEWSYRNSPLRYAVLGVLLVIMGVLGYLLYEKKRREAEDTADNKPDANNTGVVTPPPGSSQPPPFGATGPGPGTTPRPNPTPKGGFFPDGFPKGIEPKGFIPKGGNPKGFPPKGGNPGPLPVTPKTPPAGAGSPLDLLLGGDVPNLTPAQAAALTQKFKSQLLGTWKADLGNGTTAEVAYRPNGTFTETLTTGGKPKTTISGEWTAGNLTAGNKGLLITRTVNGTKNSIKVLFEDDEMIHETLQKGTSGVFRK